VVEINLLIWSAHTVSLVRCGRPHRRFCQFRRTTWTLLLVVSLLLLQDSGTLFLWTVELLYLLTHLRSGLRHFSLFRHNPHCSTRLCTMARYKCIDWLIDWLRECLSVNVSTCRNGSAACERHVSTSQRQVVRARIRRRHWRDCRAVCTRKYVWTKR